MRAALLAACAVALAACGSGAGTADSDRDPGADAVGTARSVEAIADGVRVSFAPDPGYEYFESAVLTLGEDVVLIAGALAVGDIREGNRLRVWTNECAESIPVKCKVDAVEVLDLSP